MKKRLALGCGALGALTALVCLGMVLLVVAVPVAIRGHAAWQEQLPAREAAPANGSYVHAHDVDLHVLREGPKDGPVVLLVHGTSAWGGTWRDLMHDLSSAGYHCIAVDLPPFGYSERPERPDYSAEDQAKRIVGVLDTLKIDHAILIGHSFGGGATVEAALLARERIDRLILIDVALGIGQESTPSPVVLWILRTPPIRDTFVAATFTNPWFIPFGLRSFIADPADATPAVVARYTAPFAVEGTTAAIGQWVPNLVAPAQAPVSSNPASLGLLTMPTLVLWGAADTVTPPEQGEQIAGLLPNGKLVMLDGVGHIPQIEDPGAVKRAVLRFLEDREL